MKITKVETFQIATQRYYGHLSGHVLVKVFVDDGPIGWGEASDSRAEDLAAIARQYNEMLVGLDPSSITEINELLLGHAFNSSVTDLHLASAIDMALYDLNGKFLGVPAYRLLGGKMREKLYCCYPIFGWQVKESLPHAMSYIQRLFDLGHHLFRYYVSGDSKLDDYFLSEVKYRYNDQLKLKSIDFSGRFTDWETALRYADVLRHHEPYHFEQPSYSMRVSAEFVRRVDLPVSCHINSLALGMEAIERRACTAFNVACVCGGPTHIRRLFALAEAAGLRCLIGTDQESTLGTSAQVSVGIAMPNTNLPCDPMGPLLYTESPAVQRVRARGSYLYPFEGAGLGVVIDEYKLSTLTTMEA